MLKRSRFIPSNYFIALMILICTAGCGGGGGGSSSLDQTPIARPPTVTLTSFSRSHRARENPSRLTGQPLAQLLVRPPLTGMETEVILVLNQCHPVQLGPIDTLLTCSNSDGDTLKEVSVEVIDSDTLFESRSSMVTLMARTCSSTLTGISDRMTANHLPSTTAKGTTLSKNGGEFSGINDVSFECARNRIQVAEVPGRGGRSRPRNCKEAFTMFYVPGGLSLSSGNTEALSGDMINISPFTGLFLDIVSEEKTRLGIEAIELADGCASEANLLAENVISSVKSFVQNLESNYGITLKSSTKITWHQTTRREPLKQKKIVNFQKLRTGSNKPSLLVIPAICLTATVLTSVFQSPHLTGFFQIKNLSSLRYRLVSILMARRMQRVGIPPKHFRPPN